MTHPNKEQTLALLHEWQKHHESMDKLFKGVVMSIGLDVEGPLFETVWGLFDAYTRTLAAEVGDLGDWLSWHYTENEFGAKAGQAGYDGKLKRIKTLEHLYGLIAESRKRA